MANRRGKFEIDLDNYKSLKYEQLSFTFDTFQQYGEVILNKGNGETDEGLKELTFGDMGYSSKGLTKTEEEDILAVCIDTTELFKKQSKQKTVAEIVSLCTSDKVNGKNHPKSKKFNQTTYEDLFKKNGFVVKRKVNLLNTSEFKKLEKKQVASMLRAHEMWVDKDPKGKRLIATNVSFKGFVADNIDLSGAIFVNCEFIESSFYKTKLFRTHFINSTFERTDIAKANISDGLFSDCDFGEDACITDTEIDNSLFMNCFFGEDCFLQNKVNKSVFSNVSMEKCLSFTSISNTRIEHCNFLNSNMQAMCIKDCYFNKTKFTYVDKIINSCWVRGKMIFEFIEI